MKEKPIIIKYVLPGSIAEEVGIEKDDILISINNEVIKDVFDYRFLIANEELVIELQKKDGEVWEIEIEKEEYEDLGIEFENSMIDGAKSCTNKCVFCFIDQLPKGMRDTLYFKDDDSRLSFLMGNYVTLTNMSDSDIDRIIKYKMSPINVSVHATNPQLRVSMLNNKFAGEVISRIRKLVENGITVNCQIVLCRDINDNEELDRSISDLTSLYPGVNSISVVPVGLTKHREGLAYLKAFDKVSSTKVVSQVGKWQKNLMKKFDSRIIYIADEFYIMAEIELPEYEEYEDFPQIENGVGLISELKHEIFEYLGNISYTIKNTRVVSIATGVSAYEFIKDMAKTVERKFDNLKVYVYKINNDFFGENVTVTGLLTGTDIVKQLKEKELGEELLICKSILKSDTNLLLDNYTVDLLEEQLNIKVCVVENSGEDFVKKVLGK